MNKDFNVYKWRRDYLVENETPSSSEYQVAKEFTSMFSQQKNINYTDLGGGKHRIKISDRTIKPNWDDVLISKFFNEKGYTLDNIFDDDEFKNQWVEFKKL